MNRSGYPRKRQQTPLAVAIWFVALLALIAAGILFATNQNGSWVLLVGCGLGAVAGLLRYRAESDQPDRGAEKHDE